MGRSGLEFGLAFRWETGLVTSLGGGPDEGEDEGGCAHWAPPARCSWRQAGEGWRRRRGFAAGRWLDEMRNSAKSRMQRLQ